MGIRRPVEDAEIEIERNGKRYTGSYSSDNEMVIVYFDGATKKALLGSCSPEGLARILLGELVADANRSGVW
jgi:hypothetical protein